MNGTDLKTITEAGAVGIAVLMIIYNAWQTKMFIDSNNKQRNSNENHNIHITEAINNLSSQIQGMNDHNNQIKESIEANSRVLDRVERCLDKHARK